ncbi:LOW QUALITY PROTEIN: uncharacterized protein LOC144164833 [Haemaphysalis longicornis]
MNPQLEHQPSTFLRYMAKRISDLDDRQRVVTLMVDEIHMKPFFEYKGGNITGIAHNSPEAANSALVFMVQSLTSKFKEVAHIVPVRSADGKFLHEVLKEVIFGLEKIGYKVVCVVTDNNKINRKAMEHFDLSSPTGSSSETRFVYEHPCDPARPLFFVIDPVHILKCIRNNWLKQSNDQRCFFFPEMDSEHTTERRMLTASFQTIRDVYNAEVGQLLRHAHTLTRKGLFPTDIEKQNVKLALQIFHNSLPPALRALQSKHNLQFVEGTAAFIDIVLTWWRIVNVQTPCKGKRLRDELQSPVSSLEDPQVDFLYNLLDWPDEWKNRTAQYDSGKLTKETHAALHQTTHGLVEIARYCLTELHMLYVLFGKIQTDSLEDRFGKYRQLAGSQYHVSIRQIYEGENKMRLQSTLPTLSKPSQHESHRDEQWEDLDRDEGAAHSYAVVAHSYAVVEELSKRDDFLTIPNQRQVATDLTVDLLTEDDPSDFDGCDAGHTKEIVLNSSRRGQLSPSVPIRFRSDRLGAGDHSLADPSEPKACGRGKGWCRAPVRLPVSAELSEWDRQKNRGVIGTLQHHSTGEEVFGKEYSIFEFAMPLYTPGPTVEWEEPCVDISCQQEIVSSSAHSQALDSVERVAANDSAASSSLATDHNTCVIKEPSLQEPAGDQDSCMQDQTEATESCTEQAVEDPVEWESPEPYRLLLLQALEDPESLTPDRVDELVASIFESTLAVPGRAEAGATMCLALLLAQQRKCPWMLDECNFVDHVLNACLDWFSKRRAQTLRPVKEAAAAHQQEETAVSPYCWEAFVLFLAELLTALAGVGRGREPGPSAPLGGLFCLAVLLCDCGQIMLRELAENALHEVLVLRYVLVKAGKTANWYAPTHVQALMSSLRKTFLDLRYSAQVHKVVMEVIELCASGWELDATQEEYYCGP